MFVYYSCRCGNAYKISKTDKDLHLLSLRMRCAAGQEKCEEFGLEIQDQDHQIGGVHTTAKELFVLSTGRGTPKERRCSPLQLTKLLVEGTIKEFELEPSPSDPNRSIVSKMLVGIDWAHEDSKTVVVHFATSTQGATIYKVTEL